MPAGGSLQSFHVLVISLFPRYESYKENPSFSMLSDSEEEVLYGGKKFMYDEDEESM